MIRASKKQKQSDQPFESEWQDTTILQQYS